MAALTVFLTTYNTGLQGSNAQEQDLAGWLIPVLQKTITDEGAAAAAAAPDIYAIAVQELLPLHLAFAGLSRTVLVALTNRIESLLSAHATSLSPTRTADRYKLVSRVSHVGVALWVFARESTTRGKLGKSLEASIGLWYGGMGNKGAVGVRLPVMRGEKEGGWETLTFVAAHLDAHDHNIARRNEQYQTILSSLVFAPSDPLATRYQVHDSSHLFIMGDLNYRLSHLPRSGIYPTESMGDNDDVVALEKERAELVSLDTLQREQREGRVFGGLREGDLSRFAPTYKRIVGDIAGYSKKRIPGWTDRILFASHTDSGSYPSSDAHASTTQILQFNSTPELTISDHKPVHAVLSLPPVTHSAQAPHLAPVLPPALSPHRPRPVARTREELFIQKVIGTILDRSIGWPWALLVLLGWGNAQAGMGVSAFIAMVWGVWWSGVFSG